MNATPRSYVEDFYVRWARVEDEQAYAYARNARLDAEDRAAHLAKIDREESDREAYKMGLAGADDDLDDECGDAHCYICGVPEDDLDEPSDEMLARMVEDAALDLAEDSYLDASYEDRYDLGGWDE